MEQKYGHVYARLQSRIANYTKLFTIYILPGFLFNSINTKIYLKINFDHINPRVDKVLLIHKSKCNY